MRERGGKRKFLEERAIAGDALGFRVTVIKGDGHAVAIFRGVYESVVALMFFDVVKVSERFTEEKVERGIHDKEVNAEV